MTLAFAPAWSLAEFESARNRIEMLFWTQGSSERARCGGAFTMMNDYGLSSAPPQRPKRAKRRREWSHGRDFGGEGS